MKTLVSAMVLVAAMATSSVAFAHSSNHKHHYKDGSYQYTCINEEGYCGNWNTGKPN